MEETEERDESRGKDVCNDLTSLMDSALALTSFSYSSICSGILASIAATQICSSNHNTLT